MTPNEGKMWYDRPIPPGWLPVPVSLALSEEDQRQCHYHPSGIFHYHAPREILEKYRNAMRDIGLTPELWLKDEYARAAAV